MKIFSTAEAELLIKKHYGLDVSASSLVGYDEQNFLLHANDGKKWVLKIATDEHNIHFLDAQVKIINHLGKSNMKSKFQQFLIKNLIR